VRALGIFARAPIPGQVKRRLTEEVGPSTAAEVHWQLGRRVVGAVAASGFRSTVWFAPRDELEFVREWLAGLGRVELRPQSGGPLGRRVEQALARHFADGARRVVLVGTDCAGVDRRIVQAAFSALDGHDVVVGPTFDGGAYLLGLNAPLPLSLRDLPWGRPGLTPVAVTRAKALGLAVRLLPAERAVVTARDARLEGLLKP
jgi:rSAM/selenodomain-associated transferase 1